MTVKSVVAGLIVVLLVPPFVEARQATSSVDDWRTIVAGLAPQTLVEVTLADGTRVNGRFVEVAGDTLRLSPASRARRPREPRAILLKEITAIKVQQPRNSDTAFAQSAGQIDLFAGYLNTNTFMNGLNIQVSIAGTPRWSFIGEFDGSYGSDCSGCSEKYRDVAVLGGFRFAWHPSVRISPFFQTLVGVLNSRAEGYYYSTSTNRQVYQEAYTVQYFALQPGGGATVMFSPRLGIRGQYDWQFAIPDQSQYEGMSIFPRIAVGMVVRVGQLTD